MSVHQLTVPHQESMPPVAVHGYICRPLSLVDSTGQKREFPTRCTEWHALAGNVHDWHLALSFSCNTWNRTAACIYYVLCLQHVHAQLLQAAPLCNHQMLKCGLSVSEVRFSLYACGAGTPQYTIED